MDRATVKLVTEDLRSVLEDFAKKHNLESADFKNVTFDSKGFRTTLHVLEKLDEETKVEEFDKKAVRVGLPKGLAEKEVTFNGQRFIIKDINVKARKYPIVAEGVGGGLFKLPHVAVNGF